MIAPSAISPVLSRGALLEGLGYEISQRPRRHPRFDVSWPVVVQVGKRFFLLLTVNVSSRGARVRSTERIGEGSVARLHFHPAPGLSWEVEAVVWQVDSNGLAFFFTADHRARLAELLAQLPERPAALWAYTPN